MIKGCDIREQFSINQWLDQHQIMTSLDLAKQKDILPGLRWDLVISDDANCMSVADESHKRLRYKLGELLRDATDRLSLLTATPHNAEL